MAARSAAILLLALLTAIIDQTNQKENFESFAKQSFQNFP
jgi:hypothetical protein